MGYGQFTRLRAKVRNKFPDEPIAGGTLTAVVRYRLLVGSGGLQRPTRSRSRSRPSPSFPPGDPVARDIDGNDTIDLFGPLSEENIRRRDQRSVPVPVK